MHAQEFHDDELQRFEAEGTPPLPIPTHEGVIEHDGARIWYATYGSGRAVILLHGGLGYSGNWGYQVPALVESGYQTIVMDTRGQGRSTRDEQPFSYELLASDVLAIMDELSLQQAALVGWSDGACTALVFADQHPDRVTSVFYFACNMDPSGTKPFERTTTLNRCFARHQEDYVELSPTPDRFLELVVDLSLMQRTQPNYTAVDLARITVPVAIVQGELDEFIKPEHAEHLARSIPNAELTFLKCVSHFAPLQRPDQFNAAIMTFLMKSG